MGVQCVGIERFKDYYESSKLAISQLAALQVVVKPRQVLDDAIEMEEEEIVLQRRLFNGFCQKKTSLPV